MKGKVIILTGPTAVGKTDIAIEVAERLDTEIVSADSRQIYRYMDIGTAKPTPEQRSRVFHHLIDIVYPDEYYTVADYKRDAYSVVDALLRKGKVPFIVGGSVLYIMVFLRGWPFDGVGSNHHLRRELDRELERHGKFYLYERLKEVDPDTASRLHPEDVYRVKRALEVFLISGKSIREWQKDTHQAYKDILCLGLAMDRERLYRRINARVDKMFCNGFVDEVKYLLDSGYSTELPSMKGIGYKEVCDYLSGKIDLQRTKALMKQRTRNFAKRQFTWFRQITGIVWYNLSGGDKVDIIRDMLRNVRAFRES
ncbi:MAG: tRNA (adenosine(37)-N6)-dimethylallyltransferase MiaA [Synergistetes bacterium]|nr:tRNA (adenosine(37)-N6)-dimethylallyltransferase MiaA [Synergistota bacterium]